MVSSRPPTSKSSRPFNNPLVTVPKAPITNGIIVTFMFHSFFNYLARSRYLSVFSHSVVSRDSKVDNFPYSLFFFFLLIIIRSGLLAEIRWCMCMSKSHRSLCVSFSRIGAGLCIYHLFVLLLLLLLFLLLYIIIIERNFHSKSNRCYTGVTARLFRFPGNFKVTWPILLLQLLEWFRSFL